MSTLREAAIGAMGALETARNGLAWYRDRYPESTDGSDDEAAGDIDAAIDALRAELAKPDAPMVQDGWQLVPVEPTPQMVAAYLGSNRDYWQIVDEKPTVLGKWRNGTPEEAVAFAYASMLAAAPRPAPAEPQPSQDGEAYCGLSFAQAKAKILALPLDDAHGLAISLLIQKMMLLKAPAPQPAGGEPQPAVQLTEEDVRRIVRDELAKGGA